jgi:hypothetical protein
VISKHRQTNRPEIFWHSSTRPRDVELDIQAIAARMWQQQCASSGFAPGVSLVNE